MQPVMIAQSLHSFLSVDDQRSSLARILTQHSGSPPIVSPLVQKHACFGIVGQITDTIEKPTVTACCAQCQTLLSTALAGFSNMQRFHATMPFVCHHCRHANLIDMQPAYWLHHALVYVQIQDIAGAPHLIQIEAQELQDLFNTVPEDQKQAAFKYKEAFKTSVCTQRMHAQRMLLCRSLSRLALLVVQPFAWPSTQRHMHRYACHFSATVSDATAQLRASGICAALTRLSSLLQSGQPL